MVHWGWGGAGEGSSGTLGGGAGEGSSGTLGGVGQERGLVVHWGVGQGRGLVVHWGGGGAEKGSRGSSHTTLYLCDQRSLKYVQCMYVLVIHLNDTIPDANLALD